MNYYTIFSGTFQVCSTQVNNIYFLKKVKPFPPLRCIIVRWPEKERFYMNLLKRAAVLIVSIAAGICLLILIGFLSDR